MSTERTQFQDLSTRSFRKKESGARDGSIEQYHRFLTDGLQTTLLHHSLTSPVPILSWLYHVKRDPRAARVKYIRVHELTGHFDQETLRVGRLPNEARVILDSARLRNCSEAANLYHSSFQMRQPFLNYRPSCRGQKNDSD